MSMRSRPFGEGRKSYLCKEVLHPLAFQVHSISMEGDQGDWRGGGGSREGVRGKLRVNCLDMIDMYVSVCVCVVKIRKGFLLT